ncbi:MAG: dihydrofolate reductase [Candidatus Competibacteraceae bacterium]|nr:dihydrofolate reductase [Candidatus Competibacteraceae bacterium]
MLRTDVVVSGGGVSRPRHAADREVSNQRNRPMRKLIAIEFVSLDGVLQSPGAPGEDTEGGFPPRRLGIPLRRRHPRPGHGQQMALDHCALLLGRKTYDLWANYWPHHASIWPGINEVPKYVASRNPAFHPEWDNTTLLPGDAAGAVQQLKTQDGPNLHLWGSGHLLQTLLKHDLVDELWLKILPVTLGTGKRLFGEGTMPAAFKLETSQVSPKGVIIAQYARAGAVETGAFR